MRWLETTGRFARARWRVIAFAAALVAAGGGAIALGDGVGSPEPWRDGRSEAALSDLLVDQAPGRIVVDSRGRPVLGPDGKPVRVVGPDKRLVDSKGRPLRDRSGRPLALRRGNRLPSTLAGRHPPTKRSKARKPTPGKRKPKPAERPASTPTSSRGEPLLVGLVSLDHNAHNSTLAGYGATQRTEDWEPIADAVVAHLNQTGGIDGRRVELRKRKYNPSNGQAFATLWEANCEFFAHGRRPVAVISPLGSYYAAECFAARGIPVLQTISWGLATRYYERYPDTLFSPGGLAGDRYAEPYVDAMKRQGFFKGGVKVGLLVQDLVELHDYEASLRSALQRAGVAIAAEADLPPLLSASDAPAFASAAVRAALRFKLAGIKEVVNATDLGGVGFFMKAAEPQGYHPRYGLSTHNAPLLLLASMRALGMTRQFHGAGGIGWAPLNDVAADQEGPANAGRAECDGIFSRSGVALGDRTTFGQYAAHAICDSLLALRAALAGGSGLRAGLERLGTGHASAVTLATGLSPSRHDGAASYRDLVFDGDGCGCLRYDGPLRPFG